MAVRSNAIVVLGTVGSRFSDGVALPSERVVNPCFRLFQVMPCSVSDSSLMCIQMCIVCIIFVSFFACLVPLVVPVGSVCLFRVKEKGSAMPFSSFLEASFNRAQDCPQICKRLIDYHDFPRMRGRKAEVVVIFVQLNNLGAVPPLVGESENG